MGYCSKGMKNWQCGNQNHHVCHLFDIIPKLLVVENNQIIYVSVTQIEWPSKFPMATFIMLSKNSLSQWIFFKFSEYPTKNTILLFQKSKLTDVEGFVGPVRFFTHAHVMSINLVFTGSVTNFCLFRLKRLWRFLGERPKVWSLVAFSIIPLW